IYDGPLIEDVYHSNARDYAASMRRLRELPARIVHGGHFPSFSGARLHAMIDDWLRDHAL
ncbi:MAG: MBL fold metallo-hydrolase, partial [Chromohalobacter japonicus]